MRPNAGDKQIDKTHPTYKVLTIIIIVIYCAIFSLNWNRLHYGVALRDEAFYVADAYIITNGSIPFTNNWMASTGSALLYSPLAWIYTSISGGAEGLYLFMRQAFLVYKLLVAGVLTAVFRRVYSLLLSIILPLPYLALSICSIDNFSYDTVSLSLLLISSVLLFVALQEKEKLRKQFCFVSGVLMALTILSHPLQLFTAGYVFIMLVIIERKTFKASVLSFLFAAGGCLTGILVTAYLSIRSGGIKPIIHGISVILQAPYFHIRKIGFTANVKMLLQTRSTFGDFLIISVLVFMALYTIFTLTNRKKWLNDPKAMCIIALFSAQLIHIANITYRNNHSDLYLKLNVCGAYAVILLLFICGVKAHIKLVLLLFSPFVVNYLSYIIVFSGLEYREYILFPSLMVSLALTFFSLSHVSIPPLTGIKKTVAAYAATVLLAVVLCASLTTGYYRFVYQDGPISALNYKMERGVFKGMYTQDARGKALIFLEDEIRRHTDENDTVMFRDLAPAAYMMTDARHCAPTTYNLLLTPPSFVDNFDGTSDYMLQEYFRVVDMEPSKIIYVFDPDRNASLSLLRNHQFNQYVNEYYVEAYSNNAEYFPIIIFKRK